MSSTLARLTAFSFCVATLTTAVYADPAIDPSFAPDASLNLGASVAASSKYLSTVRTDGALVYYPLSDTTGTLRDLGPYAHSGTYGTGVAHNGPIMTAMGTQSAAFVGGSFNLRSLAASSVSSHLQPSGGVTVEAWIEERTANTTGLSLPILMYGKQSAGPAYSLSISPQNSVQFWGKTTGHAASATTSVALLPGVPYHLAATYDGHNVLMYVNGHLQGTGSGTGSMNYTGLNAHDGFAVGGALDVGRAQFNGSIGHVAIYGKALAPDAVLQHFITGVAPLSLRETAGTTNRFVDTIGVNVHLHFTASVYATHWTQVRALLLGLGVHHIRDGLIDTTWAPYYEHLEDLGLHGVKATLTTTREQSARLLTSYPSRIPAAFEAYEGPNEMDIVYRTDPQWVQKAQAFQKLLYTSVKGNSATSRYRVLGPSITNLQALQRVGDLSRYMDVTNMHAYFGGYNPGTLGWGSTTSYGTYGSIPWNINVARIMGSSRPIMVTETGYNTGIMNNNVPFDMQAKYMPRLMFELYNHGVGLSEIYEFTDWDPSDHKSNLGLISSSLQPKPAYYALKNLIALMRDSGNPAPAVVSYQLGGDVANVHHAIFRRSDGSYYLALWIETRDYLPKYSPTGGGTRVAIKPQNVVVTLPRTITSESMATIADSGAVTTLRSRTSGASVTIPVTNNVSVVRLTF